VSEAQYSLISVLPALIWSIVPIVYKDYLFSNSTFTVNFYRMLFASLALSIPFIIFGFNEGIIYGMLSGILTLAIGDTFYLFAIRKIGASIATPISYTYVFFSQIAAFLLGEKITFLYFISSFLIIFGVFLFSKGDKTEKRLAGIFLSLLAATFWTLGQSMIRLATVYNMNPISIAFTRTSSACLVLGIISKLKNGSLKINSSIKGKIILALASISDLALGSSLFILSIALAGLGITIIVTSLSPLFTQLIAKISGRESPRRKDILGGIFVVSALIISFI
jgi:DME family drug/metabolite transporter